jgi:hypothetical protein
MKTLRFSFLTLAFVAALTVAAQSMVLTDSNGRLLRHDVFEIDSISFVADTPSLLLWRADGTTDTWFFTDAKLTQVQDATGVADEELYKFRGDKAQSALYYSTTFCNRELNDLTRYMTGSSFYSNSFHMGKHFRNCHKATEEELAWLADPNALPKTVEGFTRWTAKIVRLYPFGKPVPADCNQTAIGDCNTISTLADMAYLYPRFIQSIITQESTRKFVVKMFDPDGNRIEVAVNNKILCHDNGNVAQVTGKKGVITWCTIIEKALAKWLYVYKPGTGLGGFGAEGMTPILTGDGRSFAVSPGTVSAKDLARFVNTCLRHGLVVNGGFNVGGLPLDKHETITAHGHSFFLPNEEDALFAIRNPWGAGSDDHVMQCMDDGVVPPTIDLRIISPGIAALYFDTPLEPYTPPRW